MTMPAAPNPQAGTGSSGDTPTTPGMTVEQPNQNQQQPTQQGGGAAPSYDAWLQEQPEPVRQMLTQHFGQETQGLKSSLDRVRDENKELDKKLKAMEKAAGDGTDLQRQLGELRTQLSRTEQAQAFYDAANSQGCTDLRAAWLLANDLGLVDDKGQVNLAELKTRKPYLFRQVITPQGNPGNGMAPTPRVNTNNPNDTVNSAIRRLAGLPD